MHACTEKCGKRIESGAYYQSDLHSVGPQWMATLSVELGRARASTFHPHSHRCQKPQGASARPKVFHHIFRATAGCCASDPPPVAAAIVSHRARPRPQPHSTDIWICTRLPGPACLPADLVAVCRQAAAVCQSDSCHVCGWLLAVRCGGGAAADRPRSERRAAGRPTTARPPSPGSPHGWPPVAAAIGRRRRWPLALTRATAPWCPRRQHTYCSPL
jgi:hypothetical protein